MVAHSHNHTQRHFQRQVIIVCEALPHTYVVLQAIPLQREEGSGHAATIELWPR